MTMADTLSRQPREDSTQFQMDVQLHLVQFSTQRLVLLRHESQLDTELAGLGSMIMKGWPDKRYQVPSQIRKYWAYRDEMSIEDGLVMKGNCVMVPQSIQAEILQTLHSAHQGIEKTRLRARTCVHWSNMNADIKEMVDKCGMCQEAQRAQQREPIIQHEVHEHGRRLAPICSALVSVTT